MIVNAADAITAALEELPNDLKSIVEAHFLEGISVVGIQRQRRVQRREVEAAILTALEQMRTHMRRRGILASSDLL
jgi:DNA-directed RNA polymerase specialized sigma24 family protein